MPSFLVESYGSSTADDEARRRAVRAARLGDRVRYVRTTFLPDDETILHLFEAPSAETLGRAGRLADLPFERIVEAVESSDRIEESPR
jgi:hypothetical protein